MFRPALIVLSSLLLSTSVAQTTKPPEIQVQTRALPDAFLGRSYDALIQPLGATPPVQFALTKGSLPPGIILQASGALNGMPKTGGIYSFTVTITDAVHKPVSTNFTIRVLDYLTVEWKDGPRLDSNTLSGSVELTNNSGETFDQTVIIVAVNEIGKAFALGYQHFNFGPQSQQAIPYSSMLPNGVYLVHVDAVAEIPARKVIRRARLQTQQPIMINVNR
jgi:hypothetical protein